MRILYIDIDSLRPDHLGCYGYHRDTSPNIDRIAAQGVRFDNCYVSDAPCLPSRTALFAGRCGFHTGVINHGGVASEPFVEGPGRGFQSRLGQTSWPNCLRKAGLKTAAISPFGNRHSAWHWYAGLNEIHDTGGGGQETADEVLPVALDWLERNAQSDNWFLHLNFWDPHTQYRTPLEFGDPFQNESLPAWLTEEVRQQHWQGCGAHSAQEVLGFGDNPRLEAEVRQNFPRQPIEMDSMAQVRAMFDGYDTGVFYADQHVGRIFEALDKAGILDETVIIISADHGENLGELNIYGDHQTADNITCRVPLIIRWPGVTDAQAGRVERGLHYQYDFAATVLELLGQSVPDNWDGRSFAADFQHGRDDGREFLVISQGAWACQRAVRWQNEGESYLCLRSYHDGLHDFPDVMLFNLSRDPHEQNDIAQERPDLVGRALAMLDEWHGAMMKTASHPRDPMQTVLLEGGPFHTRGVLPDYLKRLRKTGRDQAARHLEAAHADESNGDAL